MAYGFDQLMFRGGLPFASVGEAFFRRYIGAYRGL